MEPPEWNEAITILDEEIDDWCLVNGDDETPEMAPSSDLSQSKFGQEVKQFFKEDVKKFFGKASEFTKKVFAKKPEEEKKAEEEAKKEKPLKAFGSKVKLGFSKLFSKKEKQPPLKFKEHKEQQ
jgi:hypothetical protein